MRENLLLLEVIWLLSTCLIQNSSYGNSFQIHETDYPASLKQTNKPAKRGHYWIRKRCLLLSPIRAAKSVFKHIPEFVPHSNKQCYSYRNSLESKADDPMARALVPSHPNQPPDKKVNDLSVWRILTDNWEFASIVLSSILSSKAKMYEGEKNIDKHKPQKKGINFSRRSSYNCACWLRFRWSQTDSRVFSEYSKLFN